MIATLTSNVTIRTSALITHIADNKGNLLTVEPIRQVLHLTAGTRIELLATADTTDIYVVKITQPNASGEFTNATSLIRALRIRSFDALRNNSVVLSNASVNISKADVTNRINNDIEFVERCIIALYMRDAFSDADEELGTRLGRWLLGLNDADKARYMPKSLVHPKVDNVMRHSLNDDDTGHRETSLNGARRICINEINRLIALIKH